MIRRAFITLLGGAAVAAGAQRFDLGRIRHRLIGCKIVPLISEIRL
jgi:hypothetical protein